MPQQRKSAVGEGKIREPAEFISALPYIVAVAKSWQLCADSSRRQTIRHVNTRHADTIVRHTVIDVEAIR
jgi:hypothetical protein